MFALLAFVLGVQAVDISTVPLSLISSAIFPGPSECGQVTLASSASAADFAVKRITSAYLFQKSSLLVFL